VSKSSPSARFVPDLGANWRELAFASPRGLFAVVLVVALVVETGQGALRALVLPELSGVAGVAVDLLWLPTLLGLLLWRVVVQPLHTSLATQVDDLRADQAALREQQERLLFDGRLRRAMDMVDDEPGVLEVVGRAALEAAGPQRRTRVLLAHGSGHPLLPVIDVGAQEVAGCGVAELAGCPAVRHGQSLAFTSSTALDTCPALRRAGPGLAGNCTPLTILEETIGVVTTTTAVDDLADRQRGAVASRASRAWPARGCRSCARWSTPGARRPPTR
jgi:hypothetical protein